MRDVNKGGNVYRPLHLSAKTLGRFKPAREAFAICNTMSGPLGKIAAKRVPYLLS